MRTLTKYLSLLMTISIIASFSLSVNAAPDNLRYSSLSVNAGGSAYTSTYSATTATRTSCYMRMYWFQFSGYSAFYIPSGKYIYTRLYSGTNKASDYASFNQKTAVGNYNYNYLPGYGGAGQSYRLKTNSNWYVNYDAQIDWSANPY